jgi:hypothetical protein
MFTQGVSPREPAVALDLADVPAPPSSPAERAGRVFVEDPELR